MFVLSGSEKLREYVKESYLLSASTSKDDDASKINLDGYFQSVDFLYVYCAIGAEDSTYIWAVSILVCHNSSSTANLTVYIHGFLNWYFILFHWYVCSLSPSVSKISQVNNLKFDITEYDALESNENIVLVFHSAGAYFITATGSETIIEYVSEIVFDSLSFVVSVTVYSQL
jgi:hypothetical protein